MAPSTPPPPKSARLAALTTASTASVVMSATRTSIRVDPMVAVTIGSVMTTTLAQVGVARARDLRQLGAALGGYVHRAAIADVPEVRAQELARSLGAPVAQLEEEVIVGIELGACGEIVEDGVERDPVHVDPAILAFALAARQAALVDQPGDEIDRTGLRHQR